METEDQSIASTPSIYTAIVESVPGMVQTNRTWEQFQSNEMPHGNNTRRSSCVSSWHDLPRTGADQGNIEAILDEDSHKLDSLYEEGEALKIDIMTYMKMVDRLHQKRDEAGVVWRTTLGKYNSYQKNFSTLHSAVVGIQSKWRDEASGFNKLAKRLQILRVKRPQLEQELIEVSEDCESLSAKVAAAQAERNKLEILLSKLVESNKEAEKLVHQNSTATQTLCDFRVMSDIENIQKQLSAQLKAVKSVREAVDLVRLCS